MLGTCDLDGQGDVLEGVCGLKTVFCFARNVDFCRFYFLGRLQKCLFCVKFRCFTDKKYRENSLYYVNCYELLSIR
jgi:hypothetical protein